MFFISKFCLLCLKEDDGFLQFIQNKGEDGVTYQEKLKCCIFEVVKSAQEFPGYICQECIQLVNMFYIFKQKSFNNNNKIKSLIHSIKQMPFSGISYHNLSVPVVDIQHKLYKFDSNNEPVKQEIKKSPLKQQNKYVYDCKYCDKKFNKKRNAEDHEKIHKSTETYKFTSKNKKYECTICHATIQYKNNLKRHFINRHFKNSIQDDSDVEIVTSTDDIIEVKDDDIEENTSHKETYNEILRSLEKNKILGKMASSNKDDLLCFICDKKFNRSCKLQSHVKSHFDECV